MAVMNVNPTLAELTRLKKNFVTARKGHKLLKDKRDELVRQFLALSCESKQLREKVETTIKNANGLMMLANSSMSDEELSVAFMVNNNNAEIEVNNKKIAGVDVPEFIPCSKALKRTDVYSYGFAFTSGVLDSAVELYNDIFPDMIRLAEMEKACQRLAFEISKTKRRVNALEHIIIPRYEETIRYILIKIQENETENITRTMKIKDMMINKYRESL